MPTQLERLKRIYGPQADQAAAAIDRAIAPVAQKLAEQSDDDAPRWTEQDVVLITYADQLRDSAGSVAPLGVLKDWLLREQLDDCLSAVHLLPFCPYSSDDGFSVIDYLAVDPDSGRGATSRRSASTSM